MRLSDSTFLIVQDSPSSARIKSKGERWSPCLIPLDVMNELYMESITMIDKDVDQIHF